MRPSLVLLLLFIGLTCAAPLTVDHEEEGKKFLGKLFVGAKNGDKALVFDMLLKKFDYYLPGFLSEEVTEAFKAFSVGQPSEKFSLPSNASLSMKKEFMKRMARLDVDALTFVNKLADDLPAFPTKLRPFAGDVKALRLKVEALPTSTKDSLIKEFPIFGKLDEIEALVKVFDNLVTHAKGFCENLPGFAECEKMLQYIE